ncbi:MAG: hypothetical protein GX649_06295 [Chloroflexi bacterium]|nr:hypothetical protein [Chloroflexota bacterium]
MASGFWGLLDALSPAQLTVAISVASAALFLIEERRLGLVALAVQYVLIGAIIGGHVYRPILFLFMGIGAAVFLVLLLSAGRVERAVREASTAGASSSAPGEEPPPQAYESMGPLFHSMALVLAGISAYGVWRAYPIADIPPELSLASYWLVGCGLVLALIGSGPLRIGFGLLTFVNGVVSAYLLIERSLLVFTLVGALYGVLVLAIAFCTEIWLMTLRGGTEG